MLNRIAVNGLQADEWAKQRHSVIRNVSANSVPLGLIVPGGGE